MKLKSIKIKNFRGIKELNDPVNLANFNIFIGDNGTAKTTIIEAINLCLQPSYAYNRLSINDFYKGEDNEIELTVEFDEVFTSKLPDGYGTQNVECNKITLLAKKRERSTPGKAFSDLVSVQHFVVPVADRGAEGWSQSRKTSENPFKFTERQLSFPNVDVDLPRVFYFSKNRNKQLIKGYNSSFSNIIDDLNWHFDKTQRAKSDDEHFKHDRKKLHEKVIADTDGDTLNKTIEATNKILDELEIEHVDLSILKTLTPYDHSEIVYPFDGFELPVDLCGSGIEMGIALALLESMAKISREEIVLIIDEPELHLHPKLQQNLFNHFKDVAQTIQIIVSTHSPILFQNVYQHNDIQLLITTKENNEIIVDDARSAGFGLLNWSPSWGEICYFAYNVSTIEFHNDLYAALQDRENKEHVSEIEDWFTNTKNFPKSIRWNDPVKGQMQETLMTYIRNRIHHADNQGRPMYTPQQLKQSIENMINLLKNP